MGRTTLLILLVAITMIYQYKGEPNLACTKRDGYCSDSDRCQSSGGYVEKLAFKCKCGNACCKCIDTCPNGSTCMSEGETCNGMTDPNGCCGTRFCCKPIMTTTPRPTTPIMTSTTRKKTTIRTTRPRPTTHIITATPQPCNITCVGECLDQCGSLAEDPAGGCCGLKCCGGF